MLTVDGDGHEYDDDLVAYVRVSTEEQSYDLQRQAMLAAKVHPDLICEDVESGWAIKKERPGFRKALKLVSAGKTLVVWKLDRLGRNTIEILLTIHRLHERMVSFRSLTQSELNTDAMQTASGKFIFHLFASLAQFESDQLSERTKAGIKAAKARGVQFGRKSFHQKWVLGGAVAKFQELRRQGVAPKEALAETGIPRTTYNKWRLIMEPPPPVDDIGS